MAEARARPPTHSHAHRYGPVPVTVSPKSRAITRHRHCGQHSQAHPTNARSPPSPSFAPFLPFCLRRSNTSTSLSALVSAKSSSTISSRSSSGARGYDHRDDSAWKGTRVRGAGEVQARGAGTAGAAEAGAATGTIEVGSEGADMDGTEAAALGRADGAEWWDGKRGGGTGSTFSDDANPRSGGRGVTSLNSCFMGPICMHLRPFFDRRDSLLQIIATLDITLIFTM